MHISYVIMIAVWGISIQSFGYFYILDKIHVFLIRVRLFQVGFGYLDFENKSLNFILFLNFLYLKI